MTESNGLDPIRGLQRWLEDVFYLFIFFAFTQTLAVLQQPPSEPEGVLLPAAAPPEDHRCRVGSSRCEGRPGRFDIIDRQMEDKFKTTNPFIA